MAIKMKIGIFYYGVLRQTGGPNGYLFNLKRGYETLKKSIDFLVLDDNTELLLNHKESKAKTFFKKNFSFLYFFLTEVYSLYIILFKKFKLEFDLNEYECLHCHTVRDVYDLRKKYKFKGKIILTPHCPEPYSSESTNYLISASGNKYKFRMLHKIFLHIEKLAYEYSDGFIFPCEEAKEIYESFPFFMQKCKGKPVEYVLTGIPYDKNCDAKDIGNPLNMLYAGRHNKIKGYTFLTENADKLLEKGNMTIAGAIDGFDYPKREKWTELGWRNDIKDIIKENDVFILPNNNTYFDLIALEVMSCKRILLATDTGGNKYIARHSKGVILYRKNDIDDLLKKIDYIKSLSKEEYKKLQNSNYEFINNRCNLSTFANSHFVALEKLCKCLKA